MKLKTEVSTAYEVKDCFEVEIKFMNIAYEKERQKQIKGKGERR